MKIAFIGLGIMGKPMAKNLLKAGHQLRVYDRKKETMDEMAAAGATLCESSVETVEGVDLVMTMLPNSPHVKSVMLEDDKLAERMPKTATFIDMSSINPVASREIAEGLAKYGIDMLDAPVSGGQPKAIDGTLAFMVGGKEEVFNKFKPVLEAMGSSVVLCGDVGAGNVTKLCNQTIVAVNIAALAEALQMGQMCGVEPEKIFQAIKGGLAGSTVIKAQDDMLDVSDGRGSIPTFAGLFAGGFRSGILQEIQPLLGGLHLAVLHEAEHEEGHPDQRIGGNQERRGRDDGAVDFRQDGVHYSSPSRVRASMRSSMRTVRNRRRYRAKPNRSMPNMQNRSVTTMSPDMPPSLSTTGCRLEGTRRVIMKQMGRSIRAMMEMTAE